MKNKFAVLIIVLVLSVFCGCNSKDNDNQTLASEVSFVSEFSEPVDTAFEVSGQTIEDYYIEGIPLLKNNFYRMIKGSDIFKDKETEVLHSGNEFTFYKDDGFCWIFYSCGDILPEKRNVYGVIITDESYKMGIGLHTGMTVDELEGFSFKHNIKYNVYSREEYNNEDFRVTHLLRNGTGILDLFAECDSIYFFEHTGFNGDYLEKADEMEIPTPYCYGFICFIKDDKVIAIATDLPTAG